MTSSVSPRVVPSELSVSALSEQEFSKRVGELYPDLLKQAYRLERSREEAEDLVQDTVERALRFRSSFRVGNHFRAWLFRIQQNLFLSKKRRSTVGRRVEDALRVDPNAWGVLPVPPAPRECSVRVERAFGELPEKWGSVMALVDLQDYSYREAAEELQVPLGTVMSCLHRGREYLKRSLFEARAEAA